MNYRKWQIVKFDEKFSLTILLTKIFRLYRVEVPIKSAHVSSSVFDR